MWKGKEMRSLDFTACCREDCQAECWRKLTDEEKDWLEKNPNRMSYSGFSDCIYFEEKKDEPKDI